MRIRAQRTLVSLSDVVPRWWERLTAILYDRLSLLVIVLLVVAIVAAAHVQFSKVRWDSEWPWEWDSDISYIWFEGYHLVREGKNPYQRIVDGNMRENNKYPTYLPLFYLAGGVTQYPFPWYSDWRFFWRIVFFGLALGTGLLMFWPLYRQGWVLMGVFAFLYWLFNRWTLHVLDIVQIDFLPVFFLVLSMLLFRRHLWTSLLCLSVSLATKQIAAILVPLYLIWVWQASDRDALKRTVRAGLAAFSVPAILSLPFLLWSFQGFVRSMLFSATRNADGHFSAPSIDEIVGLSGLPARMLMVYLMVLIYAAAWRGKLPMFLSVLLTLAVFIGFNTVLFRQYMVWIIPFIPLALCDGPATGSPANKVQCPP